MTVYDIIMKKGGTENFTSQQWSDLGAGLIDDQEVIAAMLAEGYDAMVED